MQHSIPTAHSARSEGLSTTRYGRPDPSSHAAENAESPDLVVNTDDNTYKIKHGLEPLSSRFRHGMRHVEEFDLPLTVQIPNLPPVVMAFIVLTIGSDELAGGVSELGTPLLTAAYSLYGHLIAIRTCLKVVLELADKNMHTQILTPTQIFLAASVLALNIVKNPGKRLAKSDLELLAAATEHCSEMFQRVGQDPDFIRGSSLLGFAGLPVLDEAGMDFDMNLLNFEDPAAGWGGVVPFKEFLTAIAPPPSEAIELSGLLEQ
ncbi:unnamed protein product [Parascedosporium putredinis]|uniref:Uncharacterized protein n=1 Tax=Parascedosporium putredinis TaxID=1442378 RepID=A0A9P1MDU3_9PEZI|nr:unnamed protein product [Parascedosporium putredinis]CAI8004335.1 unnamed protein product [Parascedosporium putredinis]